LCSPWCTQAPGRRSLAFSSGWQVAVLSNDFLVLPTSLEVGLPVSRFCPGASFPYLRDPFPPPVTLQVRYPLYRLWKRCFLFFVGQHTLFAFLFPLPVSLTVYSVFLFLVGSAFFSKKSCHDTDFSRPRHALAFSIPFSSFSSSISGLFARGLILVLLVLLGDVLFFYIFNEGCFVLRRQEFSSQPWTVCFLFLHNL